MTKEADDKQAKVDAARKQAAEEFAEKKRIADEQAAMDAESAKQSAELKAAADAEAAKIEKQERDPKVDLVGANPMTRAVDPTREAAEAAGRKLRLIAMSYPQTTPNEHPVFGFGGHIFRLGDLRDLFALPKL
jgi:hypothetical protein